MNGAQSVLAPRGQDAERIATLFWTMLGGATLIMLAVALLTALALKGDSPGRGWLRSERLVVWAGIILPVCLLTALLLWGLFALRAGATHGDPNALRVAVVGERWWWRVIYPGAGGGSFESANELRIPVGRTVNVELRTADVIHSFWVPSLAGKVDMIPGRTNVLSLVANAAGISRGQCAEYCGGAHALMSFHVVALNAAEFESWLAHESGPAIPPADAETRLGQTLFIASGCGACHTIRGTDAAGRIGPDLTHVGGRLSLAAATMRNDAAAIGRWIRDNQHIKPQNRMPPFGIFDDRQLAALSRYLAGLK
jgi:cytochrome c oxidase subunit 2